MATTLTTKIKDMGRDSAVTIEQIDNFVDDCIKFLHEQSDESNSYDHDIFDLEHARQEALILKYSLTCQKRT